MEYGALGVHKFFFFAEYAGRDVEAFFHLRKLGGGGLALDLHPVDFKMTCVGENVVRPFRVVGKKQQAFACSVEAPYGRNVRHGFAGKHFGVFFAE